VILLFSDVIRMAGLQRNIFDKDLEVCSRDPLTGWYRDGFCKTGENDRGIHSPHSMC